MALRALLALAYFTAHLSALRSHEARAPNVTDLAFKNTDFAMNLYRKISSFHDRNIFFSPLSISTSFSTLLLAAKGPTRTEILKGLNLEALDGDAALIPGLFQQLQGNMSQDGALRVEQDTALFLHPSLRLHSAFVQQAQSYFGVELQRLDFSRPDAKSLLNQHVSQKTGHRVQEMVESLEPLTQMMLLNTIFYQGEWERPFDPNSTAMSRFYVDKYNVVQVPMMLKEDQFWTAEDAELQARVLRLPYGGGTALLLVLPEPSADYTAVEDEISAARLRHWTRSLRRRKMEVQLPRFRLDQSYRLHEVLPHLGIRSVFQDSADLTGLSQDAHLRVSQVLHKAVIQVDEKGTTAASASSVGITAYSLPVTFILNRPFFFFLYHEATSSLLFMGRVIDPTKN